MKTQGTNLLLLTVSAFWSSSRRQRNIQLGGRYRQVSLYLEQYWLPPGTAVSWVDDQVEIGHSKVDLS